MGIRGIRGQTIGDVIDVSGMGAMGGCLREQTPEVKTELLYSWTESDIYLYTPRVCISRQPMYTFTQHGSTSPQSKTAL